MSDHDHPPAAAPAAPAAGAPAPVAPTPPAPAAHATGDTSSSTPKGKEGNIFKTVRDWLIICILAGVVIVVIMGPNRFFAARENIANGMVNATSSHPSADAIVMIVAVALIIYMVFKPQPKIIVQKTEEKNKSHGGSH